MLRLISFLSLFPVMSYAHPVRCAFDAKVVDWNFRCVTNNPLAFTTGVGLNTTQSLIASSVWMGVVRDAGLYPGNILRANLMCGGSYGGTNGAGDSCAVGSYNIGSPQIPLINDTGSAKDECVNQSPVNSLQCRWKYAETGSSGGLGAVSSNNYVVLSTGIVPNAVSSWKNDAHLAVYITSGIGDNEASAIIGINHNNTDFMALQAGTQPSGLFTTFWGGSGAGGVTATNGTGFMLGTRTSSATNGVALFKNGALIGRSTTVGGDPANISEGMVIYGYNAGTSPLVLSTFTAHLCAGYAVGRGITDSLATNAYYNGWQQFETLLTRQK